jgi:tetratricopeptide (TPR) repeat protein
MKFTSTIGCLILFLGMATGLSLAQVEGLGTIDFPTSGSPQVRELFLRGALLLHSFEYDDAREAFQQAQKMDPDFGMAYWGEAMTHNRGLWVQLDLDDARAVLDRLGPTSEARRAKFPTPREQGYLRAIEVLFGQGEKVSRDLAYAESMSQLAEEYPDDLNASSLYALSLLGTGQGQRDFATYMKAASIAEGIFSKNPDHPGAAHYLIHSYDDPIHAPLGLRAARLYAQIAPAASHAQHMPSHIFVALGMWDDVVKANEASWMAAEERIKRKRLTLESRAFHAYRWLQYGYLQLGRYNEALQTLSVMQEDTQKSGGSPRTRDNLLFMRAVYVVETEKWEDDAVRIAIDTSDLSLRSAATDFLTRGLAAVRTGNLNVAQEVLDEFKKRRETTKTPGRRNNELAVGVMEKELEALVLLAAGKAERAVQLMEAATEEEESMSLEFGPPIPVKPSHELFGEILLELNRPQEAREHFELALARAPGRVLTLLGLSRAATRSGDQEKAQQIHRQLRKIWQGADQDLPILREVTRSEEMDQLGVARR